MKKIYFFFLTPIVAAFAQDPILTENFDYTAGDPLTNYGWEAHSAAATNPVLVTSPGLEFTNYKASGIGNAAGVNNTGQDVNKQFTEQVNTTTYVSFMVNVTASAQDEYFFLIGANPITTAFRARVFAQPQDETTFKLGFSFNASTPQSISETSFNYGQAYLLVVKYTGVEGDNNDSVSLYAFTAGDTLNEEPATALIGPLNGTAADLNPGTVALRQFSADQMITVDGIIVANTWDIYEETAGLALNNSNSTILYPNPVNNGQLIINVKEESALSMYNIQGRLVLTSTLQNNGILDVSSLSSGIYIAQIANQKGVTTQKVIINN